MFTRLFDDRVWRRSKLLSAGRRQQRTWAWMALYSGYGGEIIAKIGAMGSARPCRSDALRWPWTIPGGVSAPP